MAAKKYDNYDTPYLTEVQSEPPGPGPVEMLPNGPLHKAIREYQELRHRGFAPDTALCMADMSHHLDAELMRY